MLVYPRVHKSIHDKFPGTSMAHLTGMKNITAPEAEDLQGILGEHFEGTDAKELIKEASPSQEI